MILFDLSIPLFTLIALAVALGLVALAKQTRKSLIAIINLFIYLALIIMHIFQFVTAHDEVYKALTISIAYDFGFILIAYLGYLWVDDVEAKEKQIAKWYYRRCQEIFSQIITELHPTFRKYGVVENLS